MLTNDGPGIRPALEADLRIGLVERLELQVDAGAMLGRLGFKLLLIDWDSLRLAIAPTYQGQYMVEDSDVVLDEESYPNYRVQTFIAPVIAGLPLSPRVDLLFGADAHLGR